MTARATIRLAAAFPPGWPSVDLSSGAGPARRRGTIADDRHDLHHLHHLEDADRVAAVVPAARIAGALGLAVGSWPPSGWACLTVYLQRTAAHTPASVLAEHVGDDYATVDLVALPQGPAVLRTSPMRGRPDGLPDSLPPPSAQLRYLLPVAPCWLVVLDGVLAGPVPAGVLAAIRLVACSLRLTTTGPVTAVPSA